MTTANVFKRLQTAKVAVQSVKIKESGCNSFAKYTYLELGDFMPPINTACEANGLCGVIDFGSEIATLSIVNTDTPDDRIVFSCPVSTADLKGCHPIQNLGAIQSYTRRYLWMMAFDITEHDALDATTGRDPIINKPKVTPINPIKPPLIDTINKADGIEINDLLKAGSIPVVDLFEAFAITRLGELKIAQYDDVMDWISGRAIIPEVVTEVILPNMDDDDSWPEAA